MTTGVVALDSGVANGIGQSMVALARAIGPAVGSLVLAWSLAHSLPFPLDYNCAFLFAALLSVVPVCLSFLLGPEFNAVV